MEPTDIELMLRAREGDVAAFHHLTLRYRVPLRRFFASLLPDPSQADDYVQETFLRLWASRERYEPTGRFSTYLFQIGKHYWFNQRKKTPPDTLSRFEDDALRIYPAQAVHPERILLEKMRRERVRSAIDALPEHYRLVFVLNHLEGLPYAEIASRLKIPLGTVKSRMAEAVRRLRLALSQEE